MEFSHDHYGFCPMCAGQLEERFLELEGKTRQVCKACEFIFYHNPVPAAAVVLIEAGEVLLVRRKYEPCAGDWSLPAGFVEYDESVEETAVREAKEETNLDVKLTGLVNVYSGTDYPRYSIILVVYSGEIIDGDLRAGDDASEVRFFPLDALPADIAFRNHRRALEQVISR